MESTQVQDSSKNILLVVVMLGLIKQISQGNTRVKKSSENSFAVQLLTALAHQGSKRDSGFTEQKESPTTTAFHVTVRILKHCGRKAVGEGRGERNWFLYFLLAGKGRRHKICVTVCSLPQRKVNDIWQRLNVNISNHVQKYKKLKG